VADELERTEILVDRATGIMRMVYTGEDGEQHLPVEEMDPTEEEWAPKESDGARPKGYIPKAFRRKAG
jgi:hypothetical protein